MSFAISGSPSPATSANKFSFKMFYSHPLLSQHHLELLHPPTTCHIRAQEIVRNYDYLMSGSIVFITLFLMTIFTVRLQDCVPTRHSESRKILSGFESKDIRFICCTRKNLQMSNSNRERFCASSWSEYNVFCVPPSAPLEEYIVSIRTLITSPFEIPHICAWGSGSLKAYNTSGTLRYCAERFFVLIVAE